MVRMATCPGHQRRPPRPGWAIAALGVSLACIPRPSAEDCEQLAAHVVELAQAEHEGRAAEIAETVAEEHAASLRERCIDEGTKREVSCVLAAESLEGVQDCAPTR